MMSCNCGNGTCTSCKSCGCGMGVVLNVLLIIGGLNWGLVGVGMLMDQSLNVVNMVLGSMPMIEAIIYVVVGLAAILKIFGCPCAKCKACRSGGATSATTGTGNM